MLTICATILALAAIALIATRTSIHIIIRKVPDMATIKERLSALEAGLAALGQPADSGELAAVQADVADLKSSVSDIVAEIGTDPAPQPADPAAPASA